MIPPGIRRKDADITVALAFFLHDQTRRLLVLVVITSRPRLVPVHHLGVVRSSCSSEWRAEQTSFLWSFNPSKTYSPLEHYRVHPGVGFTVTRNASEVVSWPSSSVQTDTCLALVLMSSQVPGSTAIEIELASFSPIT